ncbi:MAG: hypothetical protein ACQEXJ_16880 [Myxococcota bacterium]
MSDRPKDEDRKDAGESPEARQARLEELFQRWDQRRGEYMEVPPDEDEDLTQVSRAWTFDPFRLWVTLTLLICFVSGWVMWITRHEVAYWLQAGDTPVELGDLRERYRDGERELDVPSNTYVHAEGLFLTHESEGVVEEGEERDTPNFFLCPLFDIVVRTGEPFPDKPYHRAASIEVDPAFLDLLENRRAFPYDLTVTTEATGRLVRATQAARWHAKPLEYFARTTRLEPSEMWLLLDGEPPAAYASFAVVWGVAILMFVSALGLLARAWVRRRR